MYRKLNEFFAVLNLFDLVCFRADTINSLADFGISDVNHHFVSGFFYGFF